MNSELIGITREDAMRMAADLTVSGSAAHVIELLRQAQWSALIAALGVPEARNIMIGQGLPAECDLLKKTQHSEV